MLIERKAQKTIPSTILSIWSLKAGKTNGWLWKSEWRLHSLKGDMGALPGVTNVLYLKFGNVYLGLCICTLKVHVLCVNSH